MEKERRLRRVGRQGGFVHASCYVDADLAEEFRFRFRNCRMQPAYSEALTRGMMDLLGKKDAIPAAEEEVLEAETILESKKAWLEKLRAEKQTTDERERGMEEIIKGNLGFLGKLAESYAAHPEWSRRLNSSWNHTTGHILDQKGFAELVARYRDGEFKNNGEAKPG